jgi:hypothetical protein
MKKYWVVTGILLLHFSLIMANQDISLKGTVKDTLGEAIQGATVSLKSNTMIKDTTDELGIFILNSKVGVHYKSEQSQSEYHLTLSGKNLVITTTNKEVSGQIEFFKLDGAKIISVPVIQNYSIIQLPQNVSGLIIVKLTTANKSTFVTIFCSHSSSYFISKMETSTQGHSIQFEKKAAVTVIDSLIVTKSGFETKTEPLISFQNQNIIITLKSAAFGPAPLVYTNEFMGANCTKPSLNADPTTYPAITTLPDPFLMADGKTRIKSFTEWNCRRAEIKAMIEKYETGEKPGKPDKLVATLSNNTINISITVGSNSITMSAPISYPNGKPSAPIPAIIGINGATGSLPVDVFKKRGIATIVFTSSQIHSDGMMGGSATRTNGNFSKLYPESRAGSMIRWAWGVSRIIDALEALPDAMVDTKHLAISGCSYQGKIALYSGAFDERIALVLPHESGGGGTISWRYSDMLEDRDKTEVENLHHAQGCVWYGELLGKYVPTSVSPNSLPFDQHELIGMIAPRAVLCIESSKIARMGAEAARCSHLAARKIWTAMGVPDRMGATEENTDHCVWASGYTKDLEAFVDKFLLGKSVETNILRSKFTSIDEKKWITWETPALN